MRTAVWAVVAMLAGLVLGSLGPQADLRQARQELAGLKDQAQRRDKRVGQLDNITSMLKIPEAGKVTRRPHGDRAAASAPAGTGAVESMGGQAGTGTPVGMTNTVTAEAGPDGEPDRAATMRERIEAAASAWKVRVDLARNSFVSNVATDDAQAAEFDVLVAAMNLRLSNSVRTWVDYIKAEQTFTPETGVRMMNELSGVFVQAYSDLDRTMPPAWRDSAGEKFQVFDFVDPAAVLPLAEAEDVMGSRPPPARRASTNVTIRFHHSRGL
jgi:hypothetical protein